MAEAGLPTSDDIVGDGKLRRFQVDGESRGKENGWYILHVDDRPAGRFGSWVWGDPKSEFRIWTSRYNRALTAAERSALESRIGEQKRAHHLEVARVQQEAAERAAKIWASAQPAEAHPYLERKGIRPGKLRVSDGALVVPVSNGEGRLTTLQFIQVDGTKKFLTGGEIRGCYATIARAAPDPQGTIALVEGYATGASVHAATDFPVVVAFNAGNLESVARVIRRKFPRARIVICADNDRWTMKPVENPGLHHARKAAEGVAAYVVAPEFARVDETKPTDFNDLAQREGLGVVADQIAEQIIAQEPLIRGSEADLSTATADPEVGFFQNLDEIDGLIARAEAPPAVIQDVDSYPRQPEWVQMGRSGPIATIENVQALLEAFGVEARYDVIRKDVDIRVPHSHYLIDTAKNDKITRIISWASSAKMPTAKVPEFVFHIAGQRPYNPAAEWITSKPWDGKPRLQLLLDTVRAEGESDPTVKAFKETLMRRWLISAVAAACQPDGVSAHGVLVFMGDQYVGKTAWFKSLVPQDLKLTADGMLLRPDDKDSVYQIVTNWLVELGELDATFRKSDIAQLKAFITKDRDTLRRPYARLESQFARRTIFFASVNEKDFLADPTGNRRFWTIECAAIDHKHGLDMQQVWAEVHSLYRAGESWYLTADEVARLNAHNKAFEVINPIEELIAKAYRWDDDPKYWRKLTATEIALEIGIDRPDTKHLKQVAKAIRDRSGRARTKLEGRYVYCVPDRGFEPSYRNASRGGARERDLGIGL